MMAESSRDDVDGLEVVPKWQTQALGNCKYLASEHQRVRRTSALQIGQGYAGLDRLGLSVIPNPMREASAHLQELVPLTAKRNAGVQRRVPGEPLQGG